MKIGLFGGSFDPVHLGHLLLAETAREACELDQVWFIPAFQSPFKNNLPTATGKQRLEMMRLAVAGFPVFVVYDGEVKRKEVSYTIDTVREISQSRPDDELFLIIGADSLRDFHCWKDPGEILKLVTLVAVNRGAQSVSIPAELEQLVPGAQERIRTITMPGVDFSSSDLRERVRTGRTVRFQTPRAIEQYILQNRIYNPATNEK